MTPRGMVHEASQKTRGGGIWRRAAELLNLERDRGTLLINSETTVFEEKKRRPLGEGGKNKEKGDVRLDRRKETPALGDSGV